MRKQISYARTAFTLLETLAVVAIIAVLLAVMVPQVANFVATAQRESDKRTLTVLNDALNRYKTQGGDVNALTQGTPIGNILSRMQQPINWNGMSHQVLKQGETYPAKSLSARLSNGKYIFSKFNTYSLPGYDDSTVGYVDSVNAAGSNFDLTAINPIYTTDYVKDTINLYFENLKTSQIWGNILELYLFVGASSPAGALVKAKSAYGGSLSIALTSVVYSPAGPTAGIRHNLSHWQTIETNVPSNALAVGNRTAGCYITAPPASSDSWATVIGREGGGINSAFGPTVQPNEMMQGRFRDTTVPTDLASGQKTGFFATVERYGETVLYHNGSTTTASASARSIAGSATYKVLGAIGGGGITSTTVGMAFLGSGLTDTQLNQMESMTRRLMTSLGAP